MSPLSFRSDSVAALAGGGLFAANDRDGDRLLDIGFISLAGVTPPVDLAECSFVADTPGLTADPFIVTAIDASDVNFVPLGSVQVGVTVTAP